MIEGSATDWTLAKCQAFLRFIPFHPCNHHSMTEALVCIWFVFGFVFCFLPRRKLRFRQNQCVSGPKWAWRSQLHSQPERMPEPLTPRELPPWAAHQGSVTLGKSLALSEPSLRPKSRMRTKNLPPPLGPGPASDDPCFPSPVVVGSPRQLPRAHPGIAPTCPGRDRALRPAAAALT